MEQKWDTGAPVKPVQDNSQPETDVSESNAGAGAGAGGTAGAAGGGSVGGQADGEDMSGHRGQQASSAANSALCNHIQDNIQEMERRGRRLVSGMPTDVFVPLMHYPRGFEAAMSEGTRT